MFVNPEHVISGRYNTSIFIVPQLLLNNNITDINEIYDGTIDLVLTNFVFLQLMCRITSALQIITK